MSLQNRRLFLYLFLGLVAVIVVAILIRFKPADTRDVVSEDPFGFVFDGERALRDVEYQVALGPRVPGSVAHSQILDWIKGQLEQSGWETQIQEAQVMGHSISNVVGQLEGGGQWIVLGAHFDSRLLADRDPVIENRAKPVPGANDGASGVAVLLELARIWPNNRLELNGNQDAPDIWLVFFDAEDNGDILGWDWILGSRAFVSQLSNQPDAVVIIDMIGDANLNIYKEKHSTPGLVEEIWGQADDLGYGMYFLSEYKYRILDDHIPFLEAGIPAVDLIDFDYPYWHTLADTPDKVSASSLNIVGSTLLAWLIAK